jgi:hypothetical protein
LLRSFCNLDLLAGTPARQSLPTAIGKLGGLFLCASGKLAGIKLQFSLATLLVCMTVLAGVCATAISVPVNEPTTVQVTRSTWEMISVSHPPSAWTIAWRLALLGPLSIAATLLTLWNVRRLKSRRHTEPPVG